MLKKGLIITVIIAASILTIIVAVSFSQSPKTPENDTVIENRGSTGRTSVSSDDKSYEELKLSIPVTIMLFSGEDENWEGSFVVTKEGENITSDISLQQKFFEYEETAFKYAFETSAGITTGTLKWDDSRCYNIKSDFLPQNGDSMKLTIEYGGKKSVLELENKITEDVIPPEKAVKVFMDKYNVSEKEVRYILFYSFEDKKEWHLLTTLGYASINSVTGEFLRLSGERDAY